MDYDIPRWLKDELGLSHMSEHDLNSLIFHPRYGSLCRRFVKFLAESTLCNIKYSTVYAKEDYQLSSDELLTKDLELKESLKELKAKAKRGENQVNELKFLKSYLSHLKMIQQLQKNLAGSFEGIVNRSNLLIEQINRNLDDTTYLSNSSLTSIYDENDQLNKNEAIITNRQISSMDAKLRELTQNIEEAHKEVARMIHEINHKMCRIDCNPDLKPVEIQNLLALVIPDVCEEVDNRNHDEKELSEVNMGLAQNIRDLDQQVRDLNEQYHARKSNILAVKSQELEKCLSIIDRKNWSDITCDNLIKLTDEQTRLG